MGQKQYLLKCSTLTHQVFANGRYSEAKRDAKKGFEWMDPGAAIAGLQVT